MRVAVIHNLVPGGARRRLQNQFQHLNGDLLEFCLESATPITENPVRVPYAQHGQALPQLLRPPFRFSDQIALEAAWRRLATLVNGWRPHVLYINPCQFLQAPPLPYAKLAPSLYFCDEPRRVDYEPAAAADINSRTRWLYGPLYARERSCDRRAVASVDGVVTNSHFTAAAIQRAYGRSSTVLELGVTPTVIAPSNPTPGDYILSVGSLLESKGHELVIAAAALAQRRPPVTVVAPYHVPPYEQRLHELASQLGVELTLRVAVSDAELATLYSEAALTAYLARDEPFGLASIEAQANGCPALVSAQGGLPETIVAGVTGVACERDPAAAAAGFDRMLDDHWREQASPACVQNAARFSWSRAGERLNQLLADTAATANRQA